MQVSGITMGLTLKLDVAFGTKEGFSMKMDEFKVLSMEERLTKLNKHLLSIKDLPGRLEDKFKSGEFDFSYSLLKKNAKLLGIVIDGKNHIAYAELPVQQNVVMSKQNNVKQASQEVIKSQQTLTSAEIAFVKELYAKSQLNNEQQCFVNDKSMLIVPVMVGEKRTTGISVYSEQWTKWSEFKAKHSQYSGTDLLAMAIQEFMDKYDGSDD